MTTFTPGQIIKRCDGAVFPDNNHWAVVREPERSDRYHSVWIEGGQWVPGHDVVAVPPKEVLDVVERYGVLTHRHDLGDQFKPKADPPKTPLSMSEAQWRAAVNRQRKRAAKANEHNAQLMAACRSLEKEVKQAKIDAAMSRLDIDTAKANRSALLLIRQIVTGEL